MKKLLSREPTPEMVWAAALYYGISDESLRGIFCYQWDAAPAVPEAGEVEQFLNNIAEEYLYLDAPQKEVKARQIRKAADLITLAETERDGHLVAFNEAFEAHALPWRWSVGDYRRLLQITGGKERLRHDLATRPDAPTDEAEREALIASLHAEKNRRYARIVEQGGIGLRPGVRRLMREALAARLRLAIATTTTRSNADALLAKEFGPGWPGLVVAGACFTLPAALMVPVIAWAYVRFGQLPKAEGLLYAAA